MKEGDWAGGGRVGWLGAVRGLNKRKRVRCQDDGGSEGRTDVSE